MLFTSLTQFATLAVFVLEAYSYTFVPFHNQPLREKQTHKIVLSEKKYKRAEVKGDVLQYHIFIFVYLHLVSLIHF